MGDERLSKQGFAPVNGAQVYYEVDGEGHPLLLIHAGVADSRMWDDQFADFAAHYRTIRFDMQGFGQTVMSPDTLCSHEDVRGLLDCLDIKRAHIVGISFGGLVALDFALAHPDRVSALVLGAPSVSGVVPSERIREFWAAEEDALEQGDLDGAVELNLRLWVDGPHRAPAQVNPDVRARVATMQRQAFQIPEPDDIEEVDLEPPAIERLSDVAVPTLVVVGSLDLEEKVSLAQAIVDAMPDARHQRIENVAHMLTMEQPERFRDIVLAFLAEIDEGLPTKIVG